METSCRLAAGNGYPAGELRRLSIPPARMAFIVIPHTFATNSRRSVCNRSVLEGSDAPRRGGSHGSGHRLAPLTSVGFWICGAAEVQTFDVNRHLLTDIFTKSLRWMTENPDELVALWEGIAAPDRVVQCLGSIREADCRPQELLAHIVSRAGRCCRHGFTGCVDRHSLLHRRVGACAARHHRGDLARGPARTPAGRPFDPHRGPARPLRVERRTGIGDKLPPVFRPPMAALCGPLPGLP